MPRGQSFRSVESTGCGPASIEFHIFLRGIRKFPSLEAVKEQVDQDIRRTLAYFEEKVPGGYDNEEKNKKTAVQEKCRKN